MLQFRARISKDLGGGEILSYPEEPVYEAYTVSGFFEKIEGYVFDEYGWGEYIVIAYDMRSSRPSIGRRIKLEEPVHLKAFEKKQQQQRQQQEDALIEDALIGMILDPEIEPVTGDDLTEVPSPINFSPPTPYVHADSMEHVLPASWIAPEQMPHSPLQGSDEKKEETKQEKPPKQLSKKAKKRRAEKAHRRLIGGTGRRRFSP